jgi:hypothetical protein
LVKGDKIAPGIMNKLNRWFITLCWAPDKNRFLRAAEAKTQLSLAGFTPHQVSLVRDVAADAGYAAMERIKNMYPKEVKGYMTDNKYSFQVADLFWNVNEDIRNEFYDLMQKLFIEKMKRRAKEFELKEGAVSRKEFTSIESWTKAVKANEYDIESWGLGSKSAHNDDGRNVGEWVADFDCDNDERPHGWLKVKPVKD